MLEWRYEVVGTCHGMSPKVMLMRGISLADMPWHVPTTMNVFLKLVALWATRPTHPYKPRRGFAPHARHIDGAARVQAGLPRRDAEALGDVGEEVGLRGLPSRLCC